MNIADNRFIRLDNLEPCRPELILWGARSAAVKVRRSALTRTERADSAAFLPISAKWAVRIVPALPLDARVAQIAYLAARDGRECFYCALPLDLTTCEVEHIVAVSAGGPDHASNLCLSHTECNAAAGHLSAVEKMRLAIRLRMGTEGRRP